nr:MAG TPA: hypothetical protein [Caudoviricetes sp.]
MDRNYTHYYNFRNIGQYLLYKNPDFILTPGGYLYKVPVLVCQ